MPAPHLLNGPDFGECVTTTTARSTACLSAGKQAGFTQSGAGMAPEMTFG